ncbi:MAG TPA: NUDIX hydrolase [Nocardioidaceae bacterium]|nr:NUDIX hydrolase [Nocardioidaceae bacterium]
MSDPAHLPADRPESWPVVSSEDLYRDDWVMALRRDLIHRPDRPGEQFSRLVLEHPGAVMVLAIDDQDRVLVLDQYRHPAGVRFVELPAGLCDAEHEDPLATAKRELVEEAAVQAGSWEHLLTAYSSPGITSERMEFFLARDLAAADRGDFVLEHEEADMTVSWVRFDDLLEAVLAGRVTDGPLALAVMRYALRRAPHPAGGVRPE